MRKKIALIAALTLLAVGYGSTTFAQTQTFSISSNLPSSPVDITLANPSLQPTQIFSPVTLTTTTTGGLPTLSYQWSPTTGLNDPTLPSPTLTYDTTVTSYTVTVTDANGCTSSATLNIDFSVSASNPSLLPVSMSIFPNPNSGMFRLSLQGKPLNEPLDLLVADIVGKQVHEEQGIKFTGQLDRELDLRVLESGVYFLTIRSGEARTTQKLVIK